ncbi:hypothetical protein [Dulcicalothrix desertica]|uniref:hypothetical protein n=1 Tax=Dulcicalothrix desertica TaxID=32056 RepID=UPI001F2890C8|nr:hypothetical protein [Dulcicalothrix desertica]
MVSQVYFELKFAPPSSQSGEQYVRTQYPVEVKAYRQNRNRVSIGLVVLIDADTSTPQERLDWLARTLADDEQQNRQPDEAIAIFVPKRNIETWIHYLQGESVNEEDTYSKFPNNEANCKPSVENLAEQCRSQNILKEAPPSLQLACGELQRLLQLL